MVNRFNSKIILSAILLAGFMAGGVLAASADIKDIHVFYEGKKVRRQVRLSAVDGGWYLPVRDVARIYRMTTEWKRASKETVLSIHGTSVVLAFDSDRVVIDGVPRRMNRKTVKIKGKLFIPIDLLLAQSFAEASRCTTSWNEESSVLAVYKKTNVLTPHFYSDDDETRVVVEYDPYVVCRKDQKGKRIILTFTHGISGEDEKIKVNDGVVRSIRMKQERRKSIVEITLAKGARDVSTSFETDPCRVTVTVRRKDGISAPPGKRREGSQKTVVIDPGHGGKDPGAIGRNGTKEKDINLKLAQKLAKTMKSEGNYKVILTRDNDTFIPLLDRAKIANKHKADLFVSIHCNASLNRKSRGFEVYFLSGKATDKKAEATARLENSALHLEKDAVIKKKKVEKLLWSIAKNMFHRESADVCLYIIEQVKKRVAVKDRSAKQANFYVLRNAQMPSVLIETGFLSNREEEALLKSRRFQSKMVNAYFSGIDAYFASLE